jgi:hypothetical protein
MIEAKSTANLIKYIVCYATEREINLTTVRLVKFVYLADLYNARSFQGQTITEFPWAFVYYGPYCREVMEEIDHAVISGIISRKTFESKYGDKDFAVFSCHDEHLDAIKRLFPLSVILELQAAIKRYGDDTAALLDYVYFDTEPMIDARKGGLLDFSKARRIEIGVPIEIKKLSKSDIEIAKKHIKLLGEKFRKGRDNLRKDQDDIEQWKDNVYYQALDYLSEKNLDIGLKGVAKIID